MAIINDFIIFLSEWNFQEVTACSKIKPRRKVRPPSAVAVWPARGKSLEPIHRSLTSDELQ